MKKLAISSSFRRMAAMLLSLVLACGLAFGAHAAEDLPVSVQFWREHTDKAALENDGVDTDREATLTRQSNGTYTLELPILSFSRMGMAGHLTGLTIGDISYDGELSGQLTDNTAVLTIKNLPASALTGPDAAQAIDVMCNVRMDAGVLGEISTAARLCIWQP